MAFFVHYNDGKVGTKAGLGEFSSESQAMHFVNSRVRENCSSVNCYKIIEGNMIPLEEVRTIQRKITK